MTDGSRADAAVQAHATASQAPEAAGQPRAAPGPGQAPVADLGEAPAARAVGKLLPHAWRQDGDHVSLLATRCRRCGTLTFPPTAACPRCWQRDGLCEETLAQPGTVAACTVVHVPAEGIAAPYALAYIDFDGGVRLCGRLDSWDDITVGDHVTAVAGVLRSQPGGDLLGWLFRKARR
jgi:uncharacterized OB-fold protein